MLRPVLVVVRRPCLAPRVRYSTASATVDSNVRSPPDTNYQNAKPFSEIPGPKGLPLIGTLLQYRRGKCCNKEGVSTIQYFWVICIL